MASKADEISTTEAENVDDSQSASRSLEDTDQNAAQVASAPPGQMSDVKTKLTVIRQVDRNRARWIKLRCEWLSRRTILLASEERRWGSCRRDRSKAVIAKAISEATKAVEKASAEAQSCTAGVREGSDGTLSSPMSSPIDKFEKSTEAILSMPQRRTSRRGRESGHVARHHAMHERVTRMRSRSARPVTNLRNPVE